MNQNNTIGEEFVKFRAKHGLSQRELATIVNLEPQQVSLYEHGVSKGAKRHAIFRFVALMNKYESDISKNNLNTKSLPITNQITINEFNEIENQNENEIFKTIPFYDINVSAGDMTFLDNGLLKGAQPDGFMFIPRHIDADIAFPTYGHSMHPDISNGDVVAYKLLKDLSFFNYGMKYLVITNEQRMVKYIKPSEKPGYIRLESKNPDFGAIELPAKSIRNLLQVRYIGKTEM